MKKLFTSLVVTTLLFTGCNKASAPAAPSTQTKLETKAELVNAAAVIARGGALRCEVSKKDGAEKISYIMRGKQIRVKTTTTEMYNDGEFMYIWKTGEKTGMKTKNPSKEQIETTKAKTAAQFPDLSTEAGKKTYEDKGYTINCKESVIAPDEFRPPSDVRFTDLSTMIQNVLPPSVQQMIKK